VSTSEAIENPPDCSKPPRNTDSIGIFSLV
jgi:hypothetical protein